MHFQSRVDYHEMTSEIKENMLILLLYILSGLVSAPRDGPIHRTRIEAGNVLRSSSDTSLEPITSIAPKIRTIGPSCIN